MDRISVKGYSSFKVLSLKLRKINLLLCSNGAGHNKQRPNRGECPLFNEWPTRLEQI